MTSTLISSFRSPKSQIAAQDLLRLHSSVVKNGVLRKKGSKINIGKWPQRFVVLTNDSLFVYKNEFSKLPSKFSLLGYNKVSRCEIKGHDWCFSIIPACSIDSVKVKTFSCCSNAERKTWMLAIRTQMYPANNIHQPVMTVIDKIKLMTVGFSDEDDYAAIEQLVFETTNVSEVDKVYEDGDSDSDCSINCDSDSEDHSPPVRKTNRSLSLPQNRMPLSNAKDTKRFSKSVKFNERPRTEMSSEYETCDDIGLKELAFKLSRRRKPSDPQPSIPSGSDDSSRQSPDLTECTSRHSQKFQRPSSDLSQLPPPRYSQVLKEDGEPEHEPEHDYVNWTSIKNDDFYEYPDVDEDLSLESLCSVIDTSLDRDQLIALLQTKPEGTYLIRKSRTGDRKVLTFLAGNGQVKEYKIDGDSDNLSIDPKISFKNIDDLLKHYTSVETPPRTVDFLQTGIHGTDGETAQ